MPTSTSMTAEKSRAEIAQELYVKTQPAVDEVPDIARAAMHRVLASALRSADAAAAADLVAEVARGLVAAVKKTGDSVWHASRGVVQGAVQSAVEARMDPLEVVRVATRTLVSEQLALEGDFAAAAKGAVQGAIQAAEEHGLDVPRAARESARTAFQTANAVRKAAGIKVREVLGQRVLGYPIELD